jgi:hypothetical protein
VDPGRTSDEDEDDDFQINHAPVARLGAVSSAPHARDRNGHPPNLAADQELLNVFIQWFIDFGVKKRTISNHLSEIGWPSQTVGADGIGYSISAESPYTTAKQGRIQWSKQSIKKGSFDHADRGRLWRSLSKKGEDNLRVE